MQRNIIKLLFIGNILEYYDFAIYGVFSLMMAPAFFPAQDNFSQTLLTLLIFVSGFLARPFGGIIFGYIGDRYGRKLAVTSSILGMAIATFLIGVLPAYETIGIFAPLLLVLLRVIQGVCLGGEGTGMTVFILEHLSKQKQGLINGFVSASGIVGTLVATLIGLALSCMSLSNDASWRVAFILGGLIGVISLVLRRQLIETPIYLAGVKKQPVATIPIVYLLKWHLFEIVTGIVLAGMLGTMCYFMLVYNNILFKNILGFTTIKSLCLASWGILCLVLFMPITGWISDKYGYIKLISVSSILILGLIYNLFNILLSANTLWIFSVLPIFSLLTAGVSVPIYQYLFNLFAPLQRYSGMGFSFNIGMALFGSTIPLIATYLIKTTGSNTAPVFYIMLMALLTLLIISAKTLALRVSYWAQSVS